MTAQNSQNNPFRQQRTTSEPYDTDSVGDIELPKRSRAGSRALALVGSASVLATAIMAVADCITISTSSVSNKIN
ncbi:hypothetical protein [Kribbella sp. NPDC051620]|uniref:hypothetical protein n=1 Tax=Kribbella sp. NPDC051620 TaxID=3364120 RepID=UPI0037A5142F